MKLTFYKYQGTGNDFIMVDNRDLKMPKNDTKMIQNLCDRRFGIGADGLILLENSEDPLDDFKMVYYNSDGRQSSMCGNGGRCLVAFAKFLGIIEDSARFTAIDGVHDAEAKGSSIKLRMKDVSKVSDYEDYTFIDTGSPHHVIFTENIKALDIKKEGAAIRYSDTYGDAGTNVNFVEALSESEYSVRTYERGVEDETYSCGTGVTAVALAAFSRGKSRTQKIQLNTPGGILNVEFKKTDEGFEEIWLSGPAEQVFKGEIAC